jgi:hypothetical protein
MEKQKYDRIKTRMFVSKSVDFPVISTKDKIISTAEDSKKNRAILIILRNVILPWKLSGKSILIIHVDNIYKNKLKTIKYNLYS